MKDTNVFGWLLLLTSLSGRSASTPRVRLWRALRDLGVASLRDGAALLPATDAHRAALAALGAQVEADGGAWWLLELPAQQAPTESSLRASFDRSEAYQGLRDGLALGETTPGPLIMVVAFVGFVGGWTKELFGPDHLALAGIAGATVATFFTFLPSFLFILVGGPAIEATRHDLKFTAPLIGITAAVVGVILNLAVFFAWHVLWPDATAQAPFSGPFEWFSLLITIAAFVALWRYKVGIIPVIAASALAGLIYFIVP